MLSLCKKLAGFRLFRTDCDTELTGSAAGRALPAECAWFHGLPAPVWQEAVKLGKHVPDSWAISTRSPQGWVHSHLLFYPYMNNCTSSHQSIKKTIVKFVDTVDTPPLLGSSLMGMRPLTDGRLITWCRQNNLDLNALKTVVMEMDFRKNPAPPASIILCFKFQVLLLSNAQQLQRSSQWQWNS